MSTNQHTWADTYQQAVRTYEGQLPTNTIETKLIEHFQRAPLEVEQAIHKIAARFTSGKIHTPWPLVLKELEQAAERHTITGDNAPELHKQTHLCECAIRNALHYLPGEPDLLDEIFGLHGRLRHHDTPELREQMLEAWRHERPRGIAAEQASVAYMRRQRRKPPEPVAAVDDEPSIAAFER